MAALLQSYTTATSAEKRNAVLDELFELMLSTKRAQYIEELKALRHAEAGTSLAKLAEIMISVDPVRLFIKDEDGVGRFSEFLTDPSGAVRCLAISRANYFRTDLLIGTSFDALIHDYGKPEKNHRIVDLFTGALSDTNATVRIAAIDALAWCVFDVGLLAIDEFYTLIESSVDDCNREVQIRATVIMDERTCEL